MTSTGPGPLSGHLSRRAVMVGALGMGLVACRDGPSVRRERISYGSHAEQFGVLNLPATRKPRGVVVLIHGGSWQAEDGIETAEPIADALVTKDMVVWNLEYRRLGAGGGGTTTMADVAQGIDHLVDLQAKYPELKGVAEGKACFVGVSAGGQLAVWAASRTAETPGGRAKVRAGSVVSIAGPLMLTAMSSHPWVGSLIHDYLGGTPQEVPKIYRLADPYELIPASAPVYAVHGTKDPIVPVQSSSRYVRAAVDAGAEATFIPLPADHFTLAVPGSPTWHEVLGTIDTAVDRAQSG